MKTTPTSALNVILNIMPLNLYMEAKAKVLNYKLRSNENKQLRKLSEETLDNEMEKDTILKNKDMDSMIPWYSYLLLYRWFKN